MTTKSHQPEFVAEIIGKTLDHLIDDRKRVAVDFKTIARDTAYDEKE